MKKTLENHNGDEAFMSYELNPELGTIEKLCSTYGFIKCVNKEMDTPQERLFFHYSAANKQFGEFHVGDNVTFQRSMCKGRPLATDITLQSHVEMLEGTIERMARKTTEPVTGSISYKFNGECFYLPFNKSDLVEDCAKLKVKDEVLFEKDNKTGHATNIRKKYNRPVRVCGVVTSVKDTFGFIDRNDQVKEIYFSLSATPEGVVMAPGVELEFQVKHLRNGRQEAVNLRVLEPGTVQFLDILDHTFFGTLLRSPDCGTSSKRTFTTSGAVVTDPLAGNISYVYPGDEGGKVIQIPFSIRDKRHGYTLHPGDIVSFKIALDRRDQLQRACQVELCLAAFPSRKETRHVGVVKMFDADNGAGLIEPDVKIPGRHIGEDDLLVAFKAREWIPLTDHNHTGAGQNPPPSKPTKLTSFIVVSYTPLQVTRLLSNGQQKVTTTALRILPANPDQSLSHLKLYPAGSLHGIIKTATSSPDDLGIIVFQLPGTNNKRPIGFTFDNVTKGKPKAGDKVSFGCLDRMFQDMFPTAFNIEVIECQNQVPPVNNSSSTQKIRSQTLPDDKIVFPTQEQILSATSIQHLRGWIVILKECFGFIETVDYNALYKFDPVNIKNSKLTIKEQLDVKVGTAVEFSVVSNKSRRTVDMLLRLVPETDPMSLKTVVISRRVGVIIRPLQISENKDKENQYRGLLKDFQNDNTYTYSMMSLTSFRTKLSPGDRVVFDVVQLDHDPTQHIAQNMVLLRHTGKVSSVKKSVLTIDLDKEGGNTEIPSHFEVDMNRLESTVDVKSWNVDDIVQIDLDINKDNSRKLVVSALKWIKPAEVTRKVYKNPDDLIPRILHHRGPRIPEGESIGFTDQLRRIPRLHC